MSYTETPFDSEAAEAIFRPVALQEGHDAIILRRQIMDWLDSTVAEEQLLATPPANTFLVEEVGARQAVQRGLVL